MLGLDSYLWPRVCQWALVMVEHVELVLGEDLTETLQVGGSMSDDPLMLHIPGGQIVKVLEQAK